MSRRRERAVARAEADRALVGNAADQEQVRDARRKEDSLRRQQLADIERLLETDHGRRFLWRILEQTSVHGTVMHPGDPHMTSYRAGQQDIGHWLMQEMTEASPDSYPELVAEHAREKRNR